MRWIRASLVILAVGTLAACGEEPPEQSAAPTMSSPTSSAAGATSPAPMAEESPDAMSAGTYVTAASTDTDLSAYAGTKIVYFFHADWCPDCRATDASLTGGPVPDGLTVLKVDFDEATDLRRKYGVTQQHTFVQVDAEGTQLAKWTGSRTGAQIEDKTV